MNGLRILVGDDVNNENIILNGEPLDLYPDENIQINLKQSDVRDIATNYNDHTQDFTIPATPKNMRIVKYWHDVTYDNQFEAVARIPCRLDIGGVFFRKGSLKIKKAQRDNNGKLKCYNVSFSANLKSLKDKLAEKKIGELDFSAVLPYTEFEYSDAFVKNRIVTGTGSFLEFPLVSTSRLLNDFNALKFTNSSTANGIRKEELRPALQMRYIFQAIEKNFNVRFFGDFYNDVSILEKMYLWLSKNKNPFGSRGQIIDINGVLVPLDLPIYDEVPAPDAVSVNNEHNYFTLKNRNLIPNSNFNYTSTTIRLNASNTTAPYRIFLQQVILNNDGSIDDVATNNQENGGFVASNTEFITGNGTLVYTKTMSAISLNQTFHYRIVVETQEAITFNSVQLNFRCSYTVNTALSSFRNGRFTYTSTLPNTIGIKFNIKDNIPDITCYDLVKSLVSMFNLVIVPIADPILQMQYGTNDLFKIEYFTRYYGKLNEENITKYTSRKIDENFIKTYKKFELKHADSAYGTNIMFKKAQVPEREYGTVREEYSRGDEGEYKIESKFNLFVWRPLPNVYGAEDDFELQNTWIIADALDEDFEEFVENKPTIFFCNGQSNIPSNKRLAFTGDNNVSSELSSYCIFSNVDALDLTTYTTTLTFSKEYEFQLETRDKTLYTNNYQSLISAVYSPYSREFEVSATLPKHIYTTLSLGSQIIIGQMRYSITDLSVNLINGETKLKLNNVIEESNIIEVENIG